MIRMVDVTTGRQQREFPQPGGLDVPPPGVKAEGFSSRLLAYTADGKRMVFHGRPSSAGLDVLDVATGKTILNIKER